MRSEFSLLKGSSANSAFSAVKVFYGQPSLSCLRIVNRATTKKGHPLKADDLFDPLCPVAGASGLAFLLIESVAYAIAKFLNFIGESSAGFFAAGRRQQQPYSYADADADQ